MQNLLFYKQFETRLQELKQIWNEIRGQKPVKEEKRETTIIPGMYKLVTARSSGILKAKQKLFR